MTLTCSKKSKRRGLNLNSHAINKRTNKDISGNPGFRHSTFSSKKSLNQRVTNTIPGSHFVTVRLLEEVNNTKKSLPTSVSQPESVKSTVPGPWVVSRNTNKKGVEATLTTSVQGTEEGPQLPPGRRDSFWKTSSRKLLCPLSRSYDMLLKYRFQRRFHKQL